MLIATNGWSLRLLCLCNALAINSFPVPDSPVIRTVASVWANLPIVRKTSCMDLAEPRRPLSKFKSPDSDPFDLFFERALRISSTALSISKGLAKYSKAPPSNAATALSRSECAVIMIVGIVGCFRVISFNKSRPDAPLILISLTITEGNSFSKVRLASSADANSLNGMSSRSKVFSKTHRID